MPDYNTETTIKIPYHVIEPFDKKEFIDDQETNPFDKDKRMYLYVIAPLGITALFYLLSKKIPGLQSMKLQLSLLFLFFGGSFYLYKS